MNLCEKADNMKSCDKFQLEERDDEIVMCEHCLVRDGKYYCEQYIITKTWLPVFPGFYETIFDGEMMYEIEIDAIHEYIKPEELAVCMEENLYLSNAGTKLWNDYTDAVARQSVDVIESELKELGFLEEIKFDAIESPREYNFQNDVINITVTFTPQNIENIKAFIKENFEEWQKYLKDTFTSYDGFISFHANSAEADEWQIDSALTYANNAGAILEFICYMNEIDSGKLYYGINAEAYLDFKMLKKECIDNGWYAPPNICRDWFKSLFVRFKNEYRFRTFKLSDKVPRQFRLETPKQIYFFAVTREDVTSKVHIVKRYFKIFVFAKLKEEKKR